MTYGLNNKNMKMTDNNNMKTEKCDKRRLEHDNSVSLELLAVHEVEEIEEFLECVLEGRARQQQLVVEFVVNQHSEKLTTTLILNMQHKSAITENWSFSTRNYITMEIFNYCMFVICCHDNHCHDNPH